MRKIYQIFKILQIQKRIVSLETISGNTVTILITFLSIFQVISQRSDTEWKFSRTKLWISFFETGSTVPPPFNIMPTPKDVCRLFGCNKKTEPEKHKEREVAEKRYRDVMKCIIR